ncbi:MAG: FecR domain-containing protein [Verrucomicrobiota bacterium]
MKALRTNSSSAVIEAAAATWVLRRERGLSASEETEFECWKAEDPRHEEALSRKDRAWSAFDRPIAGGQADALIERLSASTAKRRGRRVGITLAALIVFGAIGLFSRSRWQASPTPTEARGMVVAPERRTLPDGSVVELKFGAEIVVDYSVAVRRVTLRRGEAHFEVTKNQDRPFVVEASGIRVRAVGTAFSVQSSSEAVQVLVTEGSVAVHKASPTSDAASADSTVLVEAGSATTVDLVPSAVLPIVQALQATEITARLAWRAPRIEFSELPLGEAVALMNRHSRVQFIVDDPTLAQLPVSGVFRADNSDTFVRLLEGTLGISAERSGDAIRLRPAAQK